MEKENGQYVPEEDIQESFNQLCGLRVRERTSGHCVIECDLEERHMNIHGTAHGGLIFSMMDVAGGYAAATLDSGEFVNTVTQNSSMVFLKPGLTERLTAVGDVIHRGHRICVATVCTYDARRNLVAKGEFTYYYLRRTRPAAPEE